MTTKAFIWTCIGMSILVYLLGALLLNCKVGGW